MHIPVAGLETLLRERIAPGEAQLRKAAQAAFTGALVRGYLPQTWVVITERETLTVHADVDGGMAVTPGDAIVRDGAIAIRHDLLEESLRTGNAPPPNAFHMTFYTSKGEAAFRELAKIFGM